MSRREPGRPAGDPDLPSVAAAARAIINHRKGRAGSDTSGAARRRADPRAVDPRGGRGVAGRHVQRDDPIEGPATVVVVSGGSRRHRARVGELVARELDQDLHVLDLAAVVAKYVGETIAHLDRVLRRAHQADTVVLFDEADAIFGPRTTVRDAHIQHGDRAIDHLFDRLGTFDGVAIVSTRQAPDPDDQRLRRFRLVIDMDPPGRPETMT